MPSIEISFAAPTVVVLLLLLAAGGASFFFYRFTLPAVPRTLRVLLSVLRGLALAMMLALLCTPLLRLVHITRHPPVVAVVADKSASMGIADSSGTRGDMMMHLLAGEVRAAVPQRAEARYWTFGVGFNGPVDAPPDSIAWTDELTDIGGALRGLGRDREALNLQAAILLTDGVYTVGDNPSHDASLPGIPVFTIGIGDTAEQKDILVSRIAANDLVFAGTAAPVDAVVKSTGFAGERVEATLAEGSRILSRTRFTLPPGTAETSVQLEYTPEGEGAHRYTVAISPRQGELTTANNNRSFTARVLKSRMNVLVLGGTPGPDLTVVRQTLAEDPNLSVVARTQRAGGGFYEGSFPRALVDSADCLVTMGMPTSRTTAEVMSFISNAIISRRLPLLFLGGESLDEGKIATMAPSIPVTAETPLSGEQEVDFVPAAAERARPLLTPDPSGAVAPWDKMPPLFATHTIFRLRDGAIMLGSPRVHGVTLPQPLMACRSVAGTRSLAIPAYGIWRWRLMAQASTETARFFPTFLNAAISWLTTRDEGKAVRVSTEKDEFARGERIGFAGQVYAAGARPADNAQLRVTVTGGDQTIEAEMHSLGNGRYEGALDGLAQGDYSFRAQATAGGSSLGTDAGTFTVGGLQVEFLETRMNRDLLQQIAYRTGGKFFSPATVRGLRSALDSLRSLVPREDRRTQAIELPHWHYILVALLLMLAAEWILRKRSGML
jgi:hypothetical protein